MEWFVLQVVTGKEDEYRALAGRLVPGADSGILHLPKRRLMIRRRGKSAFEDKPVFPGYLFFGTNDLSPGQAGAYRRVPGFIRWLGHGGQPEALGPEDLDILNLLLSHGDLLGTSKVSFGADQRIVVKEGPLKGLEGRIVKVDKRKGRARVRLDMYRTGFEVDFGFELIAGADKEAERHE